MHLFFWAIYPLCQNDPGAYHLANLVVHALNAWLCAALVYMWYRRFSTSLGAALFFLFHLSAFRAVYWIAGASLTLATFFSLLALLAALLFLRTQKKATTPARYWPSPSPFLPIRRRYPCSYPWP